MATCVFQDGVIDKSANNINQRRVDCAENIVRVRGEVDHLNCHLLLLVIKVDVILRNTEYSKLRDVKVALLVHMLHLFAYVFPFLIEDDYNIHTFYGDFSSVVTHFHCFQHTSLLSY